MNATTIRKTVVLVTIFLGVCTGGAWAGGSALQDALRKPVEVELGDVTIGQALEEIGKKAGVRFVLSEEAIWKLPYGEATRLSVTLKGPLAESMTEMLNAFFMRYAVGEEEVTIYPRRELEHILGRPTTVELELLKGAYTMVFTLSGSDPGALLKPMISNVLGQPAVILPLDRYSDLSDILQELGKGLSGDQALPRMALAQMLNSLGDRWYIAGPDFAGGVVEIHVVDEYDFAQAKLNQVVDVSFKDELEETVIQRLADWAGVELLVNKSDPSWLQQPISVTMQNMKLQQALRNIVVSVGGDISMQADGRIATVQGPIHPRRPSVSKSAEKDAHGRAAGGDYVGKISIPMDGGKYYIEFMLRESDLTEELRKLRAEKIKKILGRLPESAEQ